MPAHEGTDLHEDTNTANNANTDWGSEVRPPESSERISHEPQSVPSYGWGSSQYEIAGFDGLTPAMQYSQTMDDLPGQTAMLLGTSSESDPWLLRHCQFDEYGLRSFYNLKLRNIGGVPLMEKIPVHFVVTPDSVHDAASAETKVAETSLLRSRLDELIPPEWGVRLVKLFYKHVFPLMPIIRSTYFGQEPLAETDLPTHASLRNVPCHLLGAIYGVALPFARNDEQLAIMDMHNQLPHEAVWRVVYDCLQEQLHRPHLSVLQAGLFYLHKTSQDRQSYVTSRTAFKWSWLGSLVGMAHNLGLQFETRMCALPAEERQIRRRLWWAVYIEDKWLSLLMGRPPYIQSTEWDVGELDDNDFRIPREVPFSPLPLSKLAEPFRNMARLAAIAETLQSSFFSLKASQRLSEDLVASMETAKPILDRLNSWCASVAVPKSLSIALNRDAITSDDDQTCPTTLYVAYATLVAYVWRALLRPIVPSNPPPIILDSDAQQPAEEPVDLANEDFQFDGLNWDLPDLSEIALPLTSVNDDTNTKILELHQSSMTWAASLVTLTKHLSATSFGEFWYSWSNMCFAVMSSFAMVILVQSPTPEAALKSAETLSSWRHAVWDQSKISPLLVLASARINEFYVAGLDEVFWMPPHVKAAIQQKK